MKPFEARYKGQCSESCGFPIKPGELILYRNGAPQHAECQEPLPDMPVSICSKCFTPAPCFCT